MNLWLLWDELTGGQQDILLLLLLALPTLLLACVLFFRGRPGLIIIALLRKYPWTHAVFVLLIAIATALGVSVVAQERGLREASSHAADPFDLIITTAGGEVSMLLATVFLEPANLPLLDNDVFAQLSSDPTVELASPLLFGDNVNGQPLVGTTAAWVDHLASSALAEGRNFIRATDAVVGHAMPLPIGDSFSPVHGATHNAGDEHLVTHAHDFRVVGRLPPLGGPWDHAVLVPIEGIWTLHGLGTGRDPTAETKTLGPPYDPAYFPGTSAIAISANSFSALYGLQSRYDRNGTLAFFPGEVLTRLHNLLGDTRAILSWITLGTEVLVGTSVLIGLAVLSRLFAHQMALLQALGAPGRFIVSVLWGYAMALIGLGALLGMAVGYAGATLLSGYLNTALGLPLPVRVGWPEWHVFVAFMSVTALVALGLAITIASRSPLPLLR